MSEIKPLRGGLALDVCVLESAMDAVAAGFKVVLITEATRPVSANNISTAIEQMQGAGVVLTDAAVLDGLSEQNPASPAEPDVCTKAPEWAEHQRFDDSDQPCDDGRGGRI